MRHLIAAALIAAPLASPQAGVIYNWQQTVPDATFGVMTSFLEFTGSFWSDGLSVTVEGNAEFLPITRDASHIDGFTADFSGDGELTTWVYTPCSASSTPCLFYGIDPDQDVLEHPFYSFSLAVIFGDELTGLNMMFNDQNRSFWMDYSQDDGLWHFLAIGSDPIAFNCGNIGCTGTGRWVLDQATIPVPEPAPLAIMGTAAVMLAAWGSRRRRA